MFAKKYCYFLFHAGDNLHRVVLCANQYATDHVNGGGCLIIFVLILLHFAQLSTFSQYSECLHWCLCKICTFCPVQGKATDHLEGGCWSLFVFVFGFLQFWFSQLSKFAQFAEWVHWRCVQNLHTLPCARHPVQGTLCKTPCARHTVQGTLWKANLQGTLCNVHARQCHWSSGRDEIAPRLHPRLTGQHLYQACTSG